MAKAHAAPRAHSAAESWFDWTPPTPEPARRPVSAARARRTGRPGARRRRAEHFRRRRRDLLVDAVLALVLAIILISLTAGLGILLLLVVPMAAGLIAERVIRHRRARRPAGSPRRSRGPRRPATRS